MCQHLYHVEWVYFIKVSEKRNSANYKKAFGVTDTSILLQENLHMKSGVGQVNEFTLRI